MTHSAIPACQASLLPAATLTPRRAQDPHGTQ